MKVLSAGRQEIVQCNHKVVPAGEIPDGGALEEVESSSSEEDEGPPTPDGVHSRERTSSVSNLPVFIFCLFFFFLMFFLRKF